MLLRLGLLRRLLLALLLALLGIHGRVLDKRLAVVGRRLSKVLVLVVRRIKVRHWRDPRVRLLPRLVGLLLLWLGLRRSRVLDERSRLLLAGRALAEVVGRRRAARRERVRLPVRRIVEPSLVLLLLRVPIIIPIPLWSCSKPSGSRLP